MKVDYDNMVGYGCFAFMITFLTFMAGYDIYSKSKLLGAFICVFLSMAIYLSMNSISVNYKKEIEYLKSQIGLNNRREMEDET